MLLSEGPSPLGPVEQVLPGVSIGRGTGSGASADADATTVSSIAGPVSRPGKHVAPREVTLQPLSASSLSAGSRRLAEKRGADVGMTRPASASPRASRGMMTPSLATPTSTTRAVGGSTPGWLSPAASLGSFTEGDSLSEAMSVETATADARVSSLTRRPESERGAAAVQRRASNHPLFAVNGGDNFEASAATAGAGGALPNRGTGLRSGDWITPGKTAWDPPSSPQAFPASDQGLFAAGPTTLGGAGAGHDELHQ
ncbi:unnamed protein product, partial [Sphacelaria rigidula]